MRKRTLRGLIFLFILGFASPLWAQSGASVQYVYDALGRLTTVVDPSGNVATYNYDAVGNLLSITRSTTSPSGLAIFSFSPGQGSVGQTVTIQGQNFSATPSSNTVKFNGTTATVTAATTNQLTTTVPSGAATGPISVDVASAWSRPLLSSEGYRLCFWLPLRQPEHTPCHPLANKPFIIILDSLYPYVIMVSSIRHLPLVPCQPCVPATPSF